MAGRNDRHRSYRKGAEQIGCGDCLALSWQELKRPFGVDNGLRAVAQAGQFQHGFEAIAGFIDQMNVQPVGAFIGKTDLHRAKRSLQRMPDGFWPAGGVNDTPARAGNQILQGPDQRAPAGGGVTPPFGEGCFHDLGGGGAGHVEIEAAILAAQHIRFDLVKQF